mgnify:CR=1 FL=1
MIVERGRKVRHVRVSPNDCKKPKLSNALKEREIVRFPSIRSKSGRASNSESDGQSLQLLTRHRSKKSQRNQIGIEKKEFWWGPKSQYQKSLEN